MYKEMSKLFTAWVKDIHNEYNAINYVNNFN